MELPVIDRNGQTVSHVEVDDAVFDVPMNHPLVHQVVVIYQANKRQGTHDTKTRGQVSGGGRKPWIQKHTGRARQGSIRSPQWRHGGVVFGPHPRDYRMDLPKRMRRLALKCALSEKIRTNSLICIENLDGLDGKTKSMVNLIESLGLSGRALVVTESSNPNVVQAGRNLKTVWTLPVNQLNAHELLRRGTVLITVDALKKGEALWSLEPVRLPRMVRAGADETPSEEEA
ncbi:50S ribosomal protein L4 [Geodia barretti]|uniref:Large ribosomal subunit protein uL4m n=1 Tax=Geodia barretti TaxID=519541 RepID=A0AA35RKC2_GEOBA|nr:50S ribosomal protein L4 [Geodia barretti]